MYLQYVILHKNHYNLVGAKVAFGWDAFWRGHSRTVPDAHGIALRSFILFRKTVRLYFSGRDATPRRRFGCPQRQSVDVVGMAQRTRGQVPSKTVLVGRRNGQLRRTTTVGGHFGLGQRHILR